MYRARKLSFCEIVQSPLVVRMLSLVKTGAETR